MKTIKLKPKTDTRPIRFGAPWVFADQLVLDRRTRALTPGEFVTLIDEEKQYLATGTFNPNSKIAFRIFSREENVSINDQWIAAKIESAILHREKLYPLPYYRLVHAEGDGLPGLIIDRFGTSAVIQPNAAWSDQFADKIALILNRHGMANIILNASGRARKFEGLDDHSRVLCGTIPELIKVEMNGASYWADLARGQKTGLFFDQRDNHAFAAKLAKGGDVLDVFSHVGGFALAMLAQGAKSATSIDSSAPALALAEKGAEAMDKRMNFTTIEGDAFDEMKKLAELGQSFDVVVCDPPAFAPSKSALTAGLRAYERVARLAAPLVRAGGYLGLCSCSHAASPEKFAYASLRGIGRAGRQGQIIYRGAAGPDHPTHPYLDESGYLKSIFMRLF